MKLCALSVGVIALSVLAGAQSAAAIRLTAIRTQDGSQSVWEIPSSRASALPPWSPDTGDPPIRLTDAASRARTWLADHNPQIQRFELQSVTLSRVRRGADIDFWFYQIDFFGYSSTPQPGGPLQKAVLLLDGSFVEPSRADAGAPPVPAPAPPTAGPVTGAGPGVTIPRAIRTVNPQYTDEAKRRKITGSVTVQGVVGLDGMLHDTKIVKSLDTVYGLDEEALKATAQWRFEPGTRNGQPVPVMVTVEVTFYLK